MYVALLAASVSTVLNMGWNASWLKHGGSPHGMGAGPGLLAKSRTILALVVRRCYPPESFRKRKGSSFDDRLVRIDVGSVSVNFHISIRLTSRSPLPRCRWGSNILVRLHRRGALWSNLLGVSCRPARDVIHFSYEDSDSAIA